MGLNSAIRGKAEQFAIGYVIRNIESGRYGEKVKAFWFSLKGRKTIIGWTVFAIGGALAAFPDPSLMAFGGTLGVFGSYLGRFGLMSKGSDQDPPPKFPEEYRPAAVFILSASTYVIEGLTALAALLMLFGSDGVTNTSLSIIFVCQAVSTATGYFSTLIGPTPVQAATAAVVSAVEAVEVAKETVAEKKEAVVEAVDIAAEVAAQPKKKGTKQ